MKRLLLLTATLLLIGCSIPQIVKTETTTVIGEVASKTHQPEYTTVGMAGKTAVVVRHPAQYSTTVKYMNLSTTNSTETFYKKYKVGDAVECTVETVNYDDGSTEQYLRLK